MRGDISKAVLEGSSITIKPDCYPLRNKVKEIEVSMTKWTWNGTVTLGRSISADVATEEMDAAIVQTVKEMAETIEMPHNWKG